MKQDLLTRAIHMACVVHMNQLDKSEKPYILHPIHVMMQFQNIDEQIIAVLHDVVEDSKIHIAQLGMMLDLPNDVLEDINILTRRLKESYMDYIKRVGIKERTRRIKLIDLEHNMDTNRLKKPLSEKDLKRLAKYKKAYDYLKSIG